MHPSEVSVVFMVESPLTWVYDVATFLILQHCKCKLHRGFWHHALSKVCLLWTKHFNPGLQTLCSWRGRWWQRDRWLDILAACQLRTDDVLGGWVEESVDQDNCSQLRSSDLEKEKRKRKRCTCFYMDSHNLTHLVSTSLFLSCTAVTFESQK